MSKGFWGAASVSPFVFPVRSLFRPMFDPNFTRQAATRVVIFRHQNPICWSLIYPYLDQAATLKRRYGAEILIRPVEDFLAGKAQADADIIVVQPWFTVEPERLESALARWRRLNPAARIIFLDSFAPSDLQLGRFVAPYIDLYQRKALFTDRSQFLRAFEGDTNLTDYYSRLHGIKATPVDWQVPADLLDRLVLAPNFLLAPHLIEAFRGREPDYDGRSIDVHSRLATKGTPWYSAMRAHAQRAVESIPGIRLTPVERIEQRAFFAELRQSRLCWSPFGYGELCWRDLEAFMTGAVLVKPDMSHLETQPSLYRPGETYLPVKWDFSDLREVVETALAEPEMCRRIARTAWQTARDYIVEDCFVEETARNFKLAPVPLLA